MSTTMTGVLAAVIFLFIGYITLAILLGVWIYKDAKKRGVDPLIWILVFLFSQGIGLILYLLVGRKQLVTTCPNCGKSIPDDALYCMGCGSPIHKATSTPSTSRSASNVSKAIMITIIALIGVSLVVNIGTTIYTLSNTFSSKGKEKSTIFTGWYMTKSSSSDTHTWSINADILSDGRGIHTLDFSESMPSTIAISSTYDQGTLTLHLIQGEVTQSIEIKASEEPILYQLSRDFKPGSIKAELEHQDIKKLSFNAEW